MAEINGGIYPTHEELKSNPQMRKQFEDLQAEFLLESGSLDITEMNTGVKGLKVGHEAVIGLSKEIFKAVKA